MGRLVQLGLRALGQELPVLEELPEDCLPGEIFVPGRGCVRVRQAGGPFSPEVAEAWLAQNWIYVAAGLAGLLLLGLARRR